MQYDHWVQYNTILTLIIETLKARPFPASLEGLVLSFFDLMGGLLLRFFLLFPLLTEKVAEEEEEDREEDLSRVGMMRTMTEEKALARPGAPRSVAVYLVRGYLQYLGTDPVGLDRSTAG